MTARIVVLVAVAFAASALCAAYARADTGSTSPPVTDSSGTSATGTDTTGTTGSTGTDSTGTDASGTDPSGTAPSGADPTGTDPTDPTGTDPSGTTDPGSTGSGDTAGSTSDCTSTSDSATGTTASPDGPACPPASATGSTTTDPGSSSGASSTDTTSSDPGSSAPASAPPVATPAPPAPATAAAATTQAPASTQSITLKIATTTPSAPPASPSPRGDSSWIAAGTSTTTVSTPVLPAVHTSKTHTRHVLVHRARRSQPLRVLDARAPLEPVHTRTKIALPLSVSLPTVDAGDFVKIVAPTGATGTTGERSLTAAPKKLFLPPRSPLTPPNGPDSPSSLFGGPLGGGAGGAIFVVAALTGLLVLVRPRTTTRVKELVEIPLAYRRALSLDCPG